MLAALYPIVYFRKSILRQTILPIIEQQVNEGESFAPLRQIYHSLILAKWFKKNLKDTLLGQEYAEHQKISGIDIPDGSGQKVYDQYLKAFQNGAFQYLQEAYDPTTQQVVPRQYFSGGFAGAIAEKDFAQLSARELLPIDNAGLKTLIVRLDAAELATGRAVSERKANQAMMNNVVKIIVMRLRRLVSLREYFEKNTQYSPQEIEKLVATLPENSAVKKSMKGKVAFVDPRKVNFSEERVSDVKIKQMVDGFNRRGSAFPYFMMVIRIRTADGAEKLVTLDGNHRLEASRRAGFQYIPVYILDWEDLEDTEVWHRAFQAGNKEAVQGVLSQWEQQGIIHQEVGLPDSISQDNTFITFEDKKYVFTQNFTKLEQHERISKFLKAMEDLKEDVVNIDKSKDELLRLWKDPETLKSKSWVTINVPRFTNSELNDLFAQDAVLPAKAFRTMPKNNLFIVPFSVNVLKNPWAFFKVKDDQVAERLTEEFWKELERESVRVKAFDQLRNISKKPQYRVMARYLAFIPRKSSDHFVILHRRSIEDRWSSDNLMRDIHFPLVRRVMRDLQLKVHNRFTSLRKDSVSQKRFFTWDTIAKETGLKMVQSGIDFRTKTGCLWFKTYDTQSRAFVKQSIHYVMGSHVPYKLVFNKKENTYELRFSHIDRSAFEELIYWAQAEGRTLTTKDFKSLEEILREQWPPYNDMNIKKDGSSIRWENDEGDSLIYVQEMDEHIKVSILGNMKKDLEDLLWRNHWRFFFEPLEDGYFAFTVWKEGVEEHAGVGNAAMMSDISKTRPTKRALKAGFSQVVYAWLETLEDENGTKIFNDGQRKSIAIKKNVTVDQLQNMVHELIGRKMFNGSQIKTILRSTHSLEEINGLIDFFIEKNATWRVYFTPDLMAKIIRAGRPYQEKRYLVEGLMRWALVGTDIEEIIATKMSPAAIQRHLKYLTELGLLSLKRRLNRNIEQYFHANVRSNKNLLKKISEKKRLLHSDDDSEKSMKKSLKRSIAHLLSYVEKISWLDMLHRLMVLGYEKDEIVGFISQLPKGQAMRIKLEALEGFNVLSVKEERRDAAMMADHPWKDHPERKYLGTVVYGEKQFKDIKYVLSVDPQKSMTTKMILLGRVALVLTDMTENILRHIYEWTGKEFSGRPAHTRFASALESVFAHSIENAIDSYWQRQDEGPDFREDLKIHFYMQQTEKTFDIWYVANGYGLKGAETTLEKALLDSRRLGGYGKGQFLTYVQAVKFGGTPELAQDRMEIIGDERGSVNQLTIDKQLFLRHYDAAMMADADFKITVDAQGRLSYPHRFENMMLPSKITGLDKDIVFEDFWRGFMSAFDDQSRFDYLVDSIDESLSDLMPEPVRKFIDLRLFKEILKSYGRENLKELMETAVIMLSGSAAYLATTPYEKLADDMDFVVYINEDREDLALPLGILMAAYFKTIHFDGLRMQPLFLPQKFLTQALDEKFYIPTDIMGYQATDFVIRNTDRFNEILARFTEEKLVDLWFRQYQFVLDGVLRAFGEEQSRFKDYKRLFWLGICNGEKPDVLHELMKEYAVLQNAVALVIKEKNEIPSEDFVIANFGNQFNFLTGQYAGGLFESSEIRRVRENIRQRFIHHDAAMMAGQLLKSLKSILSFLGLLRVILKVKAGVFAEQSFEKDEKKLADVIASVQKYWRVEHPAVVIAGFFRSYRHLPKNELKKLLQDAYQNFYYDGGAAFPMKTEEREAIDAGVDEIAASGQTSPVVVTIYGPGSVDIGSPGYESSEIFHVLESIGERLSKDQKITLRLYDYSVDRLLDLEKKIPECIRDFQLSYNWVGDIDYEIEYGDFYDLQRWPLMIKSSNITIMRHTWIGYNLVKREKFLDRPVFDVLRAELKNVVAVGSLVISEYLTSIPQKSLDNSAISETYFFELVSHDAAMMAHSWLGESFFKHWNNTEPFTLDALRGMFDMIKQYGNVDLYHLNGKILNIGAGREFMLMNDLLKEMPNVEKMIGIDWEPRVVEEVQQRLRQETTSGKLEMYLEDARSLESFADESFEMVLFYNILDLYDSEPKYRMQLLLAAKRVLKKDGLILINDFDQGYRDELEAMGFVNALSEKFPNSLDYIIMYRKDDAMLEVSNLQAELVSEQPDTGGIDLNGFDVETQGAGAVPMGKIDQAQLSGAIPFGLKPRIVSIGPADLASFLNIYPAK